MTASSQNAGSGRLFIVSAPSGAGKTTLCGDIRRNFPDLVYSVSYTTRPPRKGEQDGRDYFFIPKAAFKKGIEEGLWAEWASVHGHYYGTSARLIQDALNAGRSVLMDIDVQGARQMLARFPAAITIFIMPPSLDELRRRLLARGTDDSATIALRLQNAQTEIDHCGFYRHIVVNDDLEKARRAILAVFAQNLQA